MISEKKELKVSMPNNVFVGFIEYHNDKLYKIVIEDPTGTSKVRFFFDEVDQGKKLEMFKVMFKECQDKAFNK